MKILLTGASGFVGRRLTRKLVEGGGEVVCVAKERLEQDGVEKSLTLDLVENSAVEELARSVDPEVIVHLAGLASAAASWRQPAEYFKVNVLATEHLLRAFPRAKLLFASSGEVYGDVPATEQPLAEDRMPAPCNPYAITKAAAERIVLAAGGKVMRFFAIVGSGQSRQFAIPSFAEQLAELHRSGGGRMKVGNLTARRDFTHLDDAVDAIELLVLSAPHADIYNLSAGEVVSIQEVLDRLIALAGVDVRVEVDPERLRPIDISLLHGDSGRLRSLGWSPKRCLDDALRELWVERLAAVSGSI